MTKNKKFLVYDAGGTMRAKVELTKEGSKIWRAGDPDEQKEINNTIAEAAKQTLKIDEVTVSVILNS